MIMKTDKTDKEMNYAIEILKTALRNEISYHTDAVGYLNGDSGLSTKLYEAYSNQTREAFAESERISSKRIPELIEAIKKLE